ncbi:MAG TPA: DUF3459 domain-containing protein [Candidatus Alistipes stercoravium]|nr:DUF3459 domain-containing protein [Candidatus Alistipes stercoravium]
MNVRQYTPEGTLRAAMRELPRLQKLGIDVVWLMPVYPIGVLERKGTLGSYYAISDYTAVNPEFGTMEDFDRFLAEAHRLGLRVILDWVANHTSPDARWIREQPADWYVRDSLGRTIVQYDWTDIAKLNYDNADMRVAMEQAMRFWLDRGIDGFRCDMACEVPIDFWRTTLPALRRDYPDIYLLAEGEDPALHEEAFDASYAWELHHLMNAIARGEKSPAELQHQVEKEDSTTPPEAFRLMFTSNHDENSWAGTEFERMGPAARVMALLTFTLPKGQPLIYTGQEMGYDHRFAFFEKDPVPQWVENDLTDFYRQLIRLRHDHEALAAGEQGGETVWMEAGTLPEGVVGFTRRKGADEVLVVANLSDREAVCDPALQEPRSEYFSGKRLAPGERIILPAWGWVLFTAGQEAATKPEQPTAAQPM